MLLMAVSEWACRAILDEGCVRMKKSATILCCCAAAVGGAVVGVSAYPLLNMARVKVYAPLNAKYTITGEHLVDPAPEDKKDRVAIYIDGNSARDLYKAMLVPERRESCGGPPSPEAQPSKTAGGLECIGDDKDGYSCAVAIMLDSGATTSATVCD
jgi:hypothetical protein